MEEISQAQKLYAPCTQCPRNCFVNRHCSNRHYSNQQSQSNTNIANTTSPNTHSKLGFCKETDEVKIASACLHFGEEPLVTVFGGSGTIFFTGCTLRCAFCQNYQISQNGMGKVVSKEEFVKICLLLQERGSENINLVTGSHTIPLIAEFIESAKKNGVTIPFCWNSSGYEKVETLKLLEGLVTIWLPDLKTLSCTLSKKLFCAEDYPEVALEAIKWMIKSSPLKITMQKSPHSQTKTTPHVQKEKIQSGVIVRHLFLPGHFEETVNTLEWLKQNADGKAIISLMSQYTPVNFSESKEQNEKRMTSLRAIQNRLVSNEEDNDLRDLIEAYDFEYLFYQELSSDTTWLPDFNRVQPFSYALAKPVWHWTKGFLQE